MLTQSLINSFIVFDLFTVSPAPQENSPNNQEELLAAEMEASISIHLDAQPLPEFDADDFEMLYGWFLS
jgi:hypothetical protein